MFHQLYMEKKLCFKVLEIYDTYSFLRWINLHSFWFIIIALFQVFYFGTGTVS